MHSFLSAVRAADAYILLGLFVLWVVVLSYTASVSRRLKSLAKRQASKVTDGSIGEITDWLNEHSDAITALKGYLESMSAEHTEKMTRLAECIQKFGMVRFNAFDDIGGEQSFALVLLDGNNSGVAISSLYSRQDARLYAKGIVNGEAERPLSGEEQRALRMALEGRASAGPVQASAGR